MTQYESELGTTFTSRFERHLIFFLVFIGVLVLTYGFFFVIDFLPEKPTANALKEKTESTLAKVVVEESDEVPNEEQDGVLVVDPYPVRIIFDSLDHEVHVLNPTSHSIEALDTALLSGAVRHPDSADFMNTGTIFLFGHSSYLPNVINKNFQAFNGLQKLEWGDTIRLQSTDREYVYRVDRVYKASANDAEVQIEMGEPKLTLVTCDSFGSKSDRYVVEATLIESEVLTQENIDKV